MNLLPSLYLALFLLYCSGFSLCKLLRLRQQPFFQLLWLGICALGVSTFAVNMVLPLSGIGRLLALLPTILAVFFYKDLFFTLGRMPRAYIFFLLTFPVIILWCAETIHFGDAYDTDLYHLQILAWAREFPAVCGLGNLHSRLANSSVWYTVAALFPETLSRHVPTFMAAIFVIAATGWSVFSLREAVAPWKKVFLVVCLPMLLCDVAKFSFANLYADHIALFICLMAVYYILDVFWGNQDERSDALKLGMLYIALSFSVKSLAAVSIVFCLIALLWVWGNRLVSHSTVGYGLLFPCVLGVLWCVRNILLSGYPVYPLRIFSLPVDWLMPLELVDGNREAVMGWARWPRSGYKEALEAGLTYWFPSWLQMYSKNIFLLSMTIVPLLLSIGSWIYIFLRYPSKQAVFFVLWMAGNLCYWFCIAPDPRFGREYFGLSLAVAWTFWAFHNKECTIARASKKVGYSIVILLLFVVCTQRLLHKGAMLSLQAPVWPEREVKEGWVLSGVAGKKFSVWSPVQGDQCGPAPLPCTPYAPPKGFELRAGGRLEDGFRIVQP